MQSGLGRPAAGARPAGIWSQAGRVCALVLSLAASACANLSQIGNLTEGRNVAVAFESVDGPPTAVVRQFMTVLKEEAGARHIAVVASDKANFRLRGYLAAHADAEGTAIAWAWDVYGADQRRAFRLDGVERADRSERARWAGADDQTLRKIARAGIEQFASLMASGGPVQATTVAAATSPPEQNRSTFAWLDDWAPEASGIFRIFNREEAKPEAAPETVRNQHHSAAIPLPQRRPEPADQAAEPALAFALPHH